VQAVDCQNQLTTPVNLLIEHRNSGLKDQRREWMKSSHASHHNAHTQGMPHLLFGVKCRRTGHPGRTVQISALDRSSCWLTGEPFHLPHTAARTFSSPSSMLAQSNR